MSFYSKKERENIMNAFINWLDLHFVPIAAKIGSQKYLVAIRDAFA